MYHSTRRLLRVWKELEQGFDRARDHVELAVEGPIATVRGARPEDTAYTGAAIGLRDVWIDLRASMRGVLEETSLADLVERAQA